MCSWGEFNRLAKSIKSSTRITDCQKQCLLEQLQRDGRPGVPEVAKEFKLMRRRLRYGDAGEDG